MLNIKINYPIFLDEVKKYIKNKKHLDLIERSYLFAEKNHKGQKRKSGEDFINHPLFTAYFLATWRMGPTTLAAALLHDILEDTPIEYSVLNNEFGLEVASLVESVTKVSYFAKENRNQIKSMYLRKLYISLSRDIRVIIIKIADRLHNMLTIEYHTAKKQLEIANETLDIYSTIALRIGMKSAQSELEDLSFKVINPQQYKKIQNLLNDSKNKLDLIVKSAKEEINKKIKNEINKEFLILGRTKTIYSIYRKIHIFAKTFDDIYDILAIRIIVNNIDECYTVLGLVHQIFTPLSGRFKDYIAIPKNNLYQSLHTTVVNSDGYIFEIQIRTKEMDNTAQYGVASDWIYKDGEKYSIQLKQKKIDQRLDVFNRILKLDDTIKQSKIDQNQNNADTYFEDNIKNDIFSSLIYVLTPKGKVITLPYGSTALDFAFRIHTEVGYQTIGAKINGRYSSFNVFLNSGDLIEIKTSKYQKPNNSWLNMVKTTSSKEKIKKYLKNQETNFNDNVKKLKNSDIVKKVKLQIKEYLQNNNLKWKVNNNPIILNKKLSILGYDTIDNFFKDVYNKIYSIEDAYKLVYMDNDMNNSDEKLIQNLKDKKTKLKLNITDEILLPNISGNLSNISCNISKCCMPIPGEKIIGIVSPSKAIKIHLTTCANIGNQNKLNIPQVDVKWNENIIVKNHFFTKLVIEVINRPGTILKISSILNYLDCPIVSMNTYYRKNRVSVPIKITIKVKNSDILKQILSSIKSLANVIDIKRFMN